MPLSPIARRLRRAVHPLYRSLETTAHPLRYLFLEITQKCNLLCRHCGSDCSAKTKHNELSTNDWICFIERLAKDIGTKPKPFIVITGGEPLCHPELFRILNHAKQQQFRLGLVTNGYGLNARTAERLGKYLASITVSLDGLQRSHDWLRGVHSSFDRAVAGIERLVEQRIRLMDVVTCVNPRNLSELPQVLELLQKLGVRRWRLFNIFPKGRAKHNAELLMSKTELRQMLDWIRSTRREVDASGFALDFSCEGYLPPKIDAAVRDEPYFCRAGICIGSVLSDGAIAACPNITSDLVQGNIRQDDFMEIWDKGFLPFRDRRWMKQGSCAQCRQWRRCQGNSLHLWDSEAHKPMLCHFNLHDEN